MFFNELPIIESGTTIVQFRPIFEKLGLCVSWDAVTQTVYGVKEKFTNAKKSYEGQWSTGRHNGFGVTYTELGMLYEGELVSGKKNGKGKSYSNGIVTITNYSDGFSFIRTWTSNLKWANKITITFRPKFYSIDYYPNELSNGSKPVSDGFILLKIYKFYKADYEMNATSYNKLSDNKDSVFAYISGTNLIANDESQMAQYDEYNLLLEEMKKVVASFKLIDME